jgi:hypothetical protein
MIFRKSLIMLLILIVFSSVSASAAITEDLAAWQQLAPGIEFNKFQLPDPNNVFVVRKDRTNPNVILESSIAQGKLSAGRETVSGMYARYDQALNFWGGNANPSDWGQRNQVVVAINGSYFDYTTDIPQGGQIYSGWYAKRFDDLGGWSGFAWKLDRTVFIGKCVGHNPEKQVVTYPGMVTQQITHINSSRGTNDLVLFTPQYNSRTGTNDSGLEVVVEMTRPTMILPSPAYATGLVRQVRNGAGNSPIPFNSIVLSASGTAVQVLLQNAHVGDEIHISQEITSYEEDCKTQNSLSWTKTYASIQGAFYFLENGQIHQFNDLGALYPDPRTAIAFNDRYIFFIVVDGRDNLHSVGMTIDELARFSRDVLGATYGVAEDGGGSSTMVINGLVVNNTFCNNYFCSGGYKTYLPLVTRNSNKSMATQPEENIIVNSAAGLERLVANGMLMVVTQPGESSTAFVPGDSVITLSDTGLRLGPGTNFASLTTLSAGSQGHILAQMNGLDGILAKGDYWWYVDFGSTNGWVTEAVLTNHP